jgi:FkbM family methyltransferase
MIRDFWKFRVVKIARKAFWLPYARLRHMLASPAHNRAARTAYGVRMVQRWHDRTFVYCHAGIYGRFLADEIERRATPFVFVDIGANQGLFSLIAAANPACRGVIAFEPVHETAQTLRRNLALNGVTDRVKVLQLAISEVAGPLPIHVPPGHSGMASLAAGGPANPASPTEVIEAIAAPQLDLALAGDLPMLVKVDVEGHEATVLGQLLACSCAIRIDAIFYEIDTRWSEAGAIAALLQSAGFTRFRKVGAGQHFDVMAQR